MKSKEWALLLDLLLDIIETSSVYSEEKAKKLQKLINYVGKM